MKNYFTLAILLSSLVIVQQSEAENNSQIDAGLPAAKGVATGSNAIKEVGRLSDGRAYRVDEKGYKIVDHVAELEATVDSLNRQVNSLENQLDKQDGNKFAPTGIKEENLGGSIPCLLYTSPSPRDGLLSRMPSSA